MPNGKSRRIGDQYERDVVKWLKSRRIHVTRAKRGNTSGDVLGTIALVLECKAGKKLQLGQWVDQAIEEGVEAGLPAVVIHKRRGKGDVGKHYATMRVEDFVELLLAADWAYQMNDTETE